MKRISSPWRHWFDWETWVRVCGGTGHGLAQLLAYAAIGVGKLTQHANVPLLNLDGLRAFGIVHPGGGRNI